MRKLKGTYFGEHVWWCDPEGLTSGWYYVVKICGVTTNEELKKIMEDDNFSWEDAIIGIDDCYSYAEVTLDELRFGASKSKRKCA